MANGEKNYVMGFGLSYAVVAIFSAILVVLKELIPAIKDFLVLFTGHHWGTHGILVIILFLILGYVFAGMDLGFLKDHDTLNWYIIGSTVVSFLLIFLLFVLHYIGIITFD